MKTILLCAAVLPIIAACASGPEASATPSTASGYEERESARTGSNVSRRAPSPNGAPATK
jgi:hypothetical protein